MTTRGILRGIPNFDVFPLETNATAFNCPVALNVGNPTTLTASGNGLAVGGQVNAEQGFLGLIFVGTQYGGAARLDLRGSSSGSSSVALVPSLSGETLSGWNTGGARTAAVFGDTAVIECVATENWSATAWGSKYNVYTTPNGGGSPAKSLVLTLDQDQSATLTNKLTWGSVSFGTKTANYNMTDGANGTSITFSGSSLSFNGFNFAPAVSIGGGNLNTWNTTNYAPVITVTQSQVLAGWATFSDSTILQAATGSDGLLAGISYTSVGAAPTIKVQDAHTHTLASYTGYGVALALSVAGGGALTITTLNNYKANSTTVPSGTTVTTWNGIAINGPTVSSGATVTTYTAANIPNPGVNSGTFTTLIGVDVANLTRATTNIGVRNASTEIYTPTTATLSAAGSAITHTSAFVMLNNTSGGAVTLTSAPTITDGQDGETITLVNTSTNNVVIQDQGTLASSNLRLSATTITLGTRDNITLMYSSTVGDWVQVGTTNVL